MTTDSIYSFVRTQRDNYKSDLISIEDGLDFNQKDILRRVELYYNSQFETGSKDSLGRDKPFYNIVKSRVNLATRATDIDVKDIQVESEVSEDYARSFLFRKEIQQWMKNTGFARLLNKMGKTRNKFGGLLVKKIEHNGELEIHVVPWKDVVTDQTDIMKGVIIERHFYTPSELMAMGNVWDNVEDAVKIADQDKDEDTENDAKKTPGNYIEVWEIHGDLPVAYLKIADGKDPKEADWYTYEKQVHIIAGVDEFTNDVDGKLLEEQGLTLFFGKEKKTPYKYLSWDEIDGRALGVGVIEDSFEAQVWTNDAKLKERDLMELASKLLYWTNDKKIGRNVLTDMENGDMITLSEGKQISPINTISGSIPQFQNLIKSWNDQANAQTSQFESNTGAALPSGTPFRLAALLNQEANSHFVYRLEEMGTFVEEIFHDWIMPYFEKKLKNGHILAAEFSRDELDRIDEAFIESALKGEIVKQREKGILITDVEPERQRLKDKMMQTKAQRYIKAPKDYYKNLKAKIRVIITNEQRNKAVLLESLSSILSMIMKFPNVFPPEMAKKILEKIMEISGISPIEISTSQAPQAIPAQPTQPGQPGQQPSPQLDMNTNQTQAISV
jgi:hypothetical protein